MTKNKIEIVNKMKEAVKQGLKEDHIIFMGALGVKIPSEHNPLKSGDLELWSDPVEISEGDHDAILKILKSYTEKE